MTRASAMCGCFLLLTTRLPNFGCNGRRGAYIYGNAGGPAVNLEAGLSQLSFAQNL